MGKKKMAETSLEAFRQLTADKLREDYKKILTTLSIIGESTSEQIAAKMKVKPDKVWKRLSELKEKELIYKPGTRKPLKSGCNGFCWALTEKGKLLVSSSDLLLPGKPIQDFSRALNQPTPSQNTVNRLF